MPEADALVDREGTHASQAATAVCCPTTISPITSTSTVATPQARTILVQARARHDRVLARSRRAGAEAYEPIDEQSWEARWRAAAAEHVAWRARPSAR